MIGTILKFMFTGKDNESYELLRGLTALCVVAMLIYIGLHLWLNKQFDPLMSCTGLGLLLTGGGLGSAIKDGTLTKAKAPTANIESADSVTVNK